MDPGLRRDDESGGDGSRVGAVVFCALYLVVNHQRFACNPCPDVPHECFSNESNPSLRSLPNCARGLVLLACGPAVGGCGAGGDGELHPG